MEKFLEACFLEWFRTGRGVVWREEMIGIIFWFGAVGVLELGIRKTNCGRRAKGRVGGEGDGVRRTGVGRGEGSWGFRARETCATLKTRAMS